MNPEDWIFDGTLVNMQGTPSSTLDMVIESE
jgi:hypothetical protein